MSFLGCLILGLCPTSSFVNPLLKRPLLTVITVGQTAGRLAFPHAGLGQVQLDLQLNCVCCICMRIEELSGFSQDRKKNHSTQDSHVVPHHGTNWAALWLTLQIRRDAVLSKSYGRG